MGRALVKTSYFLVVKVKLKLFVGNIQFHYDVLSNYQIHDIQYVTIFLHPQEFILIKHYIWEQRKQKGILSSAHFIIYFKKQVKEWYKAQTMPDSNVNLKFLTRPEYKNIIKQW